MIGQETREVERKMLAILKVLSESSEPLGSITIARELERHGISLSERAVRYHLKIMDERGLTHLEGRWDGRSITPKGIYELDNALVSDRLGSIASRIEILAYQSSIDPKRRTGQIPIDLSIIKRQDLRPATEAMKVAFDAGLCIGNLVAIADEGSRPGEVIVPEGRLGLVTVSSATMVGSLLKSGVPVDPRFSGVLEVKSGRPVRFVELIEYSGCSLNPTEVFAASRMTSVTQAANDGNGKILAHFHEMPALCKSMVETVVKRIEKAGLNGLIMLGQPNEPLCEMPVGPNKIGIILQSGLNPVACAIENGIDVAIHTMSGVLGFERLVEFSEIRRQFEV